jgi:hypothetical protein
MQPRHVLLVLTARAGLPPLFPAPGDRSTPWKGRTRLRAVYRALGAHMAHQAALPRA